MPFVALKFDPANDAGGRSRRELAAQLANDDDAHRGDDGIEPQRAACVQ